MNKTLMHNNPTTRRRFIHTNVSRRQFLAAAAATWATTHIVPCHVLGGPGQTAPGAKVNLAGVGVGGVGFGQLRACDQAGFNIVALCDVDDVYAKKAYDKWPQARRYRDYREMLQAEGDKIDAVYCGTPDHTHAVVTLAALRRKKHVCCVKPLTRTVEENRAVVAAAIQAGVCTQVTAQANTSEPACRTCELIQAGAIGPVREVHIWSNRPLWPQGMTRPPGQDVVPATLDWDLWIGPAAMRPFKNEWPENDLVLQQIVAARGRKPNHKSVYHPWNFRGWWDFGTGSLGDMGCHYFNTPFRALKLEHAVAVQASTTRAFDETAPLAAIVTYDYPARGEMPAVRVVWYDGGLKPPAPHEIKGRPLPDEGVLYIGDKGKMLGPKILPVTESSKFDDLPKTLRRRDGTWAEWMEAIKGGEKAGCHFEWAGLLTEAVLLGNIAIRTGQRIEWDAPNARVTNVESANKLVAQPYRSGWTL
ncbi:MAG: Gfo/Idh/MocA family oxidoreductase [Verrucomicrobia bacterium]|nr:Gfo/Idh/MocA family oxidoreductase [Verrucomicrobiota bacterium]